MVTLLLNLEAQILFFLFYGFIAWALEVAYVSIDRKTFVNRGLLTLPIDFEIGLSLSLLCFILPTFGRNIPMMFLAVLAHYSLWSTFVNVMGSRLTKHAIWLNEDRLSLKQKAGHNVIVSALMLVFYLVLQPVAVTFVEVAPPWLLHVLAIATVVLVALDFSSVTVAMRMGQDAYRKRQEESAAEKLSTRMVGHIWKRLEKAYPGLADTEGGSEVVFARGMSVDKMVWIFLLAALIGDIIETFYCGLVNGEWMSRSSVVFGPFSFVWGIGAVLLSVALKPLVEKNDRWIFLGGAFLGGAFEYAASVFTEVVFGTVFWDYSYMPLNIGGRTNVLFMFFWGIISVVWIKTLFPKLEKLIESFPTVAAKISTWVIVAVMAFNGLFTAWVMVRFNERRDNIAPATLVDAWIDENYGDNFVTNRWPNMITVDKTNE